MSKKGTKEAEDDDAWVFDSLVGFLRGPVWNVPILTFIEHKSLIFEPDIDEEDEYKKVHDEYKNLVDFMLGSYMEDIGITPEQFENACGVASTKIKSQFHNALFEQVWAADDYVIFKRMMIQKNIELQLQALELLQQKYGALPSSLTPDAKKSSKHSESEDKVMEEVAKKSMAEHKEKGKSIDKEEKKMAEAIVASKNELSRLEQQRNDQQAMLAEHFKTKVSISDPSVALLPAELADKLREQVDTSVPRRKKSPARSRVTLPPHLEPDSHGEDAQENALPDINETVSQEINERTTAQADEEAKDAMLGASPAMSSTGPGPNAEVDEGELRRRTEFLKAQRDKLLAMKKEEREKQLAEAEQQQIKSRPKSARAARSAFGRGRGKAGPGGAGGAGAGIDPQTLKVRKALAEKLKQEVIGKN